MRKNLTESDLFAQDIAELLARVAGTRQTAPRGEPWQVRKFCRISNEGGGIRVVLGMHCMPREVNIMVRQTQGDNRREATFEGTITWPGIGSQPTQVRGSAHRTFAGIVEITHMTGLPLSGVAEISRIIPPIQD